MPFDFSRLKSIARGEPVKRIDIKVFDEGEQQTTQEQGQQAAPVEEQERQAEAKYESAELELDSVTACSKALMKLTDAQKSKLRGFIAACQCRGLTLITDDKRRVYLDTVDGEPIRRDVSDLFTWIYGFSECALLVYLGTQDATIAEELNNTAIRVGCDLFTAAYLATEIKRDLYLATCEDWKFKPQNLPQDASLIIGDKSV